MANFKTHLLVASTLSGVAAVSVVSTQTDNIEAAWRYYLLGVIGGLLPDVDSDNSIPTQVLFTFLGLTAAFWVLLQLYWEYRWFYLLAIWLVVFAIIKFVVFEAFARLTVHRGSFHSLLAVVFFGLATVNVSYFGFIYPAFDAWMHGFFVALGYFIHLCLDELFSVDLMNNRLKRSFGTAVKPFSIRYWPASTIMLAATCALYWYSPGLVLNRQLAGTVEAFQDSLFSFANATISSLTALRIAVLSSAANW